jgi:hypothetical protein
LDELRKWLEACNEWNLSDRDDNGGLDINPAHVLDRFVTEHPNLVDLDDPPDGYTWNLRPDTGTVAGQLYGERRQP